MTNNVCYHCKKERDHLINEFEDLFCDYVCLIKFHELLQHRTEKKWAMKLIKCSCCEKDIDQYRHHTLYADYERVYLCDVECLIYWMKKTKTQDSWIDKHNSMIQTMIKSLQEFVSPDNLVDVKNIIHTINWKK